MNDTDILADAIRAYAAVKLARQRSKEEIAAAVAALRDNNMAGLAECLIGSLPFTPSDETLRRLTHE